MNKMDDGVTPAASPQDEQTALAKVVPVLVCPLLKAAIVPRMEEDLKFYFAAGYAHANFDDYRLVTACEKETCAWFDGERCGVAAGR